MKRKKWMPHQKRFAWTILLSLVIFVLPFIYYQPPYDQLESKQITVAESYYREGHRKSTSSSSILSTERDYYKVSGRISSRSVFEEKLLPQTTVQIKYYQGISWVFPTLFIEELTVNEDRIVTYKDRQTQNFWVFGSFSFIIFIIGFSFYADSAHLLQKIKRARRKAKKGLTKKL